jgi:hypothetical protein
LPWTETDHHAVIDRHGHALLRQILSADDGQEDERAEDDPQEWERESLHLASSDAISGTSTLNNSPAIATSPPFNLSTSERT